MNGIRAVQAYRRHDRNEQILHEVNVEYRDANNQAFKVMSRFTATVRLVGNVTMAVVLAWGALRVVDGTLQLGVLAAFTLYLRRLYDPLDDLAMFANSYSAAVAALEKISGVLEEEPSVPEPAEPTALPRQGRRGDLRFDGVEFRYAPDSPVVLPEFDLHVPAGQTIAVVGATGAGKSTLAKLVARFYDPAKGTVSLDGVDLRDVADVDLRSAVTMVTQENFLFAGSVADNIAMGRPDATADGRTISSAPCPRATTPTSASAAAGCPPASGSWWRSPGRCWPTRRCWCSTRPRPAWTCRPSVRCRRRWRPCWPTARRSSSPTACPPS
jgi:ABC-type multidrug transport system fused ATPase/permease subunit